MSWKKPKQHTPTDARAHGHSYDPGQSDGIQNHFMDEFLDIIRLHQADLLYLTKLDLFRETKAQGEIVPAL